MNNKILNKKRKLEPGEIIRLSYDEAFCIMFANPKHLSILTMLVSKILQVRYEDLEGKIVLEPRTIPNTTIGEKLTERDVVVKVNTDEARKLVLEVNIRSDFFDTIMNRNIHYMEEVSTSGILQNESYEKLPTTILVNFNNFNRSSKKRVFDEYLYRNIDGDILTTKRRILNIDIVKSYQICYNKKEINEELNEYENDLLFIAAALWTNKENEFKECLKKIEMNKKIKSEIMEVLLTMCQDEKLVGRYHDYKLEEERTRKGIEAEIRKKSLTEGIQKGIEKMIINFYKQGVSFEIISKASGFSSKEIKNIINNYETTKKSR